MAVADLPTYGYRGAAATGVGGTAWLRLMQSGYRIKENA